MSLRSPEQKVISCVNADYPIIASTFHLLEKDGFKIVPYLTYDEAWGKKEQIGSTSLLILEAVLYGGITEPDGLLRPNKGFLGIHLLQQLRTAGYRLPAVFWTTKSWEDLASHANLTELDASYIRMITLPSELREHIKARL